MNSVSPFFLALSSGLPVLTSEMKDPNALFPETVFPIVLPIVPMALFAMPAPAVSPSPIPLNIPAGPSPTIPIAAPSAAPATAPPIFA